MHIYSDDLVKRRQEVSHLQARKRPQRNQTAHSLFSTSWLAELQGNKFLLLKPPALGILLWQPKQNITVTAMRLRGRCGANKATTDSLTQPTCVSPTSYPATCEVLGL